MPVRITVFRYAIAIGSFFLACNRHTSSSVDSFIGPVRGDTVSYSNKMDAQLLEDSLEQTDAYYYRINRVKRIEITDDNTVETIECDRFGHELSEICYFETELFWKDRDVYNRFGHLVQSRHEFYSSAPDMDLLFETTNIYEQFSSGIGERIVSTEMICHDYDDDRKTVYRYTYRYEGYLLVEENRFVDSRCEDRSYYTYTPFNKVEQKMTIHFEANGPDTTIEFTKYDSLNRKVSCSEKMNGILLKDRITEYYANGRTSKYTSIAYKDYSVFTIEYFYLANGLIEYRLVTHSGKTETERYRYAYY